MLLDAALLDVARRDLIVVFGGARNTLDLLRLATVRSDDVLLVIEAIDAATRRCVDHFAVDLALRRATEQDVAGANAVLVALGEVELENRLVRAARRQAIPVHVAGRPLVSDFTPLELVERHAATFAKLPWTAAAPRPAA